MTREQNFAAPALNSVSRVQETTRAGCCGSRADRALRCLPDSLTLVLIAFAFLFFQQRISDLLACRQISETFLPALGACVRVKNVAKVQARCKRSAACSTRISLNARCLLPAGMASQGVMISQTLGSRSAAQVSRTSCLMLAACGRKARSAMIDFLILNKRFFAATQKVLRPFTASTARSRPSITVCRAGSSSARRQLCSGADRSHSQPLLESDAADTLNSADAMQT